MLLNGRLQKSARSSEFLFFGDEVLYEFSSDRACRILNRPNTAHAIDPRR
jgi:hypothetical protein